MILRDDIPTIPEPNKWCLVGGQVDKGETFLEAVRREIKEEVNLSPKSIKYLGKLKTSDTIFIFFLVDITEKETEKIKIGNEGQKVQFFTIPEIKKLNLAKDIKLYLKTNGKYLALWLDGNKSTGIDKLKIS